MQRKVIQIANSTQLISLPRRWATTHNIKKGDELDVKEEGNKIVVSKEQIIEKEDSIEIDITDLDRDSLIFLIRGLYLRGYSKIKLIFHNSIIPHHHSGKGVKVFSVIHGEINRSTGLEIIEQKSNFCELRNISSSSLKEFDNLLRRILLLTIDAMEDLYIGVKDKNFILLETMEEKHDTITKLILYNLRVLNTISSKNHKDTIILFHFISTLDLIIDILKNTSREIYKEKFKFSPKCGDILKDIYLAIKKYYNLYYNFDFKKIEEFSSIRDKTIKNIRNSKLNLTKNDIWLLVSTEHCLEILRGLYSFIISINY